MKYLLIFFLLSTWYNSFSQEVFTFRSASENNVSDQSLDSIYMSGTHVNPSMSVFSDREAYVKSYVGLLQDLGKFLRENNFFWEKETRGFNRIYFKENGSIDYFIYQFSANQID